VTLTSILQYANRREMHRPPKTKLHIALCARDEKTARLLKRNVAVIVPATWPGEVRTHVLIGNDTGIDEKLRVTLADLQWAMHEDLDLIYPEELELGWANE
jgi:hypothetical protein